jgi:hypothetical protein
MTDIMRFSLSAMSHDHANSAKALLEDIVMSRRAKRMWCLSG